MDEEENFAKLLSQSTTAAVPAWNDPSTEADPWANPFSDAAPSANPFASPFGTASAYVPASSSDPYAAPIAAPPDSPRDEVSPYVTKLEEDEAAALGRRPDPPSVIAAREQAGFGDTSISQPPYSSFQNIHPTSPPKSQQQPQGDRAERRGLPSDLIDEDLLAASDPSASLKKAFVKSVPAPAKKETKDVKKDVAEGKAYVFTPAKKESAPKEPKEEKQVTADEEPKPPVLGNKTDEAAETKTGEATDIKEAPTTVPGPAEQQSTPTKAPTSIPLPDSTSATPTATRTVTPAPPADVVPEPSPIPFTPSTDRVAVSPLDPPPNESDYGFQSLAIGGSSTEPPPPPTKSPVREPATANVDGWTAGQTTSPPSGSRFSGKGWGAVDDEVEDGLFGKGGPSIRTSAPAPSADLWGGSTVADTGEGGWGEPGVASLGSPAPSAGLSRVETPSQSVTPPENNTPVKSISGSTPRTPKVMSKPLFQIAVGDPTRVGDPVRGYTVYTVKTRTTSPHYRRGEFSVLRRFSDFLWLFETLTMNNPGVIVPPVPDKHPFGRFQDTFIETRRLALQRCLTKVTAHPVLQLDPDLRLFLESDHFAAESKNRRAEAQQQEAGSKGLLAGWTGPKFVEQDDWFDSRRAFLDSLESQLRGLSKSLEAASKSRLDLATSIGDFALTITALAESDLGSAMCSALARLNDLAVREKEGNEEQAKAEVVNLLNLSDEYVRFIGSVRMAFAGRVKSYERWQMAEREVGRLRANREKMRQQGKLGDRGPQTLAEVGEAERRSRDASAEFDAVSKLVKSEFGRFEKERVEEFKGTLEKYLDGMILRQKEMIEAWEEYHAVVLKMVQKVQAPAGQQGR